ncbi:hypothetical protein BH23ACT10_BH23ACT10_32500 [soil metagenome]
MTAVAWRASRVDWRWRTAAPGTTAALSLVLAANAACLLGLARGVTAVYVLGAVAIAASLARHRPVATIEFSLWLWILGPQVRRVVDVSTGYHDPSYILVAAPLASLVLLPHIRALRWQGLRRPVRPMLMAVVAVSVGYAVGAVQIGLRPATGALLLWLVPPLLGLQAVAVGDDYAELEAAVERVFVWGALIVGIYGIVQFYAVPSWDAFWMNNAPIASIGSPHPFEVRVFSTLNSPGPLATFLAAAVLYLTSARHPLRVPAQVAGLVCLALSMVRAAWLATLIGLVFVMAAGRSRARATALTALALVAVAILQVSGPVEQAIVDRIDESRAGNQDDSFVARLALHEEMIPALADDVVGRGLGASGVAARLGDGSTGIVDLDSGLLDFAFTLGLPAALFALAAVTMGGAELARSGLRRGVLPVGVVAAGLSILLQMLGGNTLTGVGGVVFFVVWGVGIRALVSGGPSPAGSGVR